ncbi:hypothetical protein Leryth_018903 [Lithospermum erythrorhizon]|nr:hypothetical protein Leryth_018903 [Lithospermum erythrorhizon]
MEPQINKQSPNPNLPPNSQTLTPNFGTYSSPNQSPDPTHSLEYEYDKTPSYSLNSIPISSVYSWSTCWDMVPKTTSSSTNDFDTTGDKCGFNTSLEEVGNVDLEQDKVAIVGSGLSNVGNTCFLNSILQCFIHTVPLLQGLLAFDHKMLCNTASVCVICALFELIDLALTSTGRSVSPWKFVDNLSYISSSFQRFQQEDAHEFLQCFLDRLESCCDDLKPLSSSTAEGHNFVKQVFGGRLVSKLKCCNCGHCSDTYESSIDLSLEIDDADNLLTALESFTKVEKIEDIDTQFTCEKCKEKVSIEKQLLLDQAPSIFAFHLKRFKNDGSFVEKIDKCVEFPLELDMLPFTGPSKVNDEELTYDLYAVVVHIGFSSNSGHYYCFVRLSPGAWYKFDDSKVVRVREEYVLSQEAYILFYAKKGTPWFSDFIDTQNPVVEQRLLNTSPKSVLDSIVDIYSSCSTSTVLTSHGCDGKEGGPTEDPLAQNLIGLEENKIEGNETKDDQIKTGLHPMTSSTPVACHADHMVSPSVLKESNRNQPFGINNGVVENTSKFAKVTPKAHPSSVSPEIYRKDYPDIVYPIPRGHLKSAETVTCKRRLNDELEDMGRKQACSLIKKSIPGSRRQQLMAAVKGPYSEGSVNKKRSRLAAATRSDRNSTGRDRSNTGPGARILTAASNFR